MNKFIVVGFLILSIVVAYLAYLDYTSLVKPTISAYQGLALMSLLCLFLLIFFIQEKRYSDLLNIFNRGRN